MAGNTEQEEPGLPIKGYNNRWNSAVVGENANHSKAFLLIVTTQNGYYR